MFHHINRFHSVKSVLRFGKDAFNCEPLSTQSVGFNTKPKWQILTGSPSSTSLLLNVDGQTPYLFNCGESTGKMLKYFGYDKKVSTLKHVFVTNAEWKNIGGIPGLCLALKKANFTQGYNFPSLTIHGSHIIPKIHQITGNYKLDKSSFLLTNFKDQTYFEDHSIKVKKIPLLRTRVKERPEFHTSLDAEAKTRTTIKEALDNPNYEDMTAFAFVVSIRETEQSSLVVDLPDSEYLPSLTYLLPSLLGNINAIFNLSAPDIIQHSSYRKWLELWPESVKHITPNTTHGHSPVIKDDYYEKLRRINSKTFPKLFTIDTSSSPQCYTLDGIKMLHCSSGHIIQGNGKVTSPENLHQLSQGPVPHEKPNKTRPSYPIVQFLGTGSAESNLHRNVAGILIQTSEDSYIMLDCGEGSLAQLAALKGPETETVLSKLKMIFISHQHSDHHLGLNSILLAREKALAKMQDKSTKDEDTKSFKIEEEKSANQLFIISSGFYAYMLARYHTLIEPVCSDIIYINSKYLLTLTTASSDRIDLLQLDETQDARFLREQNLDNMFKATGLKSIQTCPAIHSVDSFSIAFTIQPQRANTEKSKRVGSDLENGFKITYSGDTRPNRRLSAIGQDSDLLIHEATLSNCSLDQALVHKHSTQSEAILVGKNMQAKFTILTHFASIFQEVPQIIDLRHLNTVGIAFDFMTVDPSSLSATCSSLTYHIEKEFRETLLFIENRLRKSRNPSIRKINIKL